MARTLTVAERRRLADYRRRLRAEIDARDYGAYGDRADDIRKADEIYHGKVAVAVITNTEIDWGAPIAWDADRMGGDA